MFDFTFATKTAKITQSNFRLKWLVCQTKETEGKIPVFQNKLLK